MKNLIIIVTFVALAVACKGEKQDLFADGKALSMANFEVPQEEVDSKIPKSYSFDYKLTVEIASKEGSMDVHYMVKPDATYYGMVRVLDKKDLTKNSITIMDIGRKKVLTCRNGKGGKFLRSTAIPEVENEADRQITIERTDTKKILGYDCQGYKINTDDGTSVIYLTQDAGFAFNKGFGAFSKMSLNNKGIDTAIVEELENGLLLVLEYKGNGNITAKMTVKEVLKLSYSVDLSEYKTIGS